MFRTFLILAIVALSSLLGYRYWPWKELRYGAGWQVAPDEPLQLMVPAHSLGCIRGSELTGLAEYAITARVLSTRRYRYEPGSDLAPIDVAAGWGSMSDEAVLNRLEISQSFRFFFYEWKGTPPLPPREMALHAANMHIIPASPEVEKAVFGLRRGSVVTMRGELVSAKSPEGRLWTSSLSREDTGPGACEVFYVEHVIKN